MLIVAFFVPNIFCSRLIIFTLAIMGDNDDERNTCNDDLPLSVKDDRWYLKLFEKIENDDVEGNIADSYSIIY